MYTPVLLLGLTSASTSLVYMHVTELHVCKCTILYSKQFFVINTTLTCITQMIIGLCENARIYAHDIQRVNSALPPTLPFQPYCASTLRSKAPASRVHCTEYSFCRINQFSLLVYGTFSILIAPMWWLGEYMVGCIHGWMNTWLDEYMVG